MILISHRGNLNEPKFDMKNSPNYINNVIDKGAMLRLYRSI